MNVEHELQNCWKTSHFQKLMLDCKPLTLRHSCSDPKLRKKKKNPAKTALAYRGRLSAQEKAHGRQPVGFYRLSVPARAAWLVLSSLHHNPPLPPSPAGQGEAAEGEQGQGGGLGTGSGRSIFMGFKQVRQAREAAEYLQQFLASERLS